MTGSLNILPCFTLQEGQEGTKGIDLEVISQLQLVGQYANLDPVSNEDGMCHANVNQKEIDLLMSDRRIYSHESLG